MAKQQDEIDFERILQTAVDAILALNTTGEIVFWSRGATEVLGYSASEMTGREYSLLLPHRQPLEDPLYESQASQALVHDLRTQRRCKDGRLIDVSLTRAPLQFHRSGALAFVEILRDVTSHRRMERELIANEKMAAVGKMASKVVHEIRNPLGSINLNVDILLDTLGSDDSPEEQEAREILQTMKRETRRLSQITEEYLQFSRMPQSSRSMEDLNGVLLELTDFLRPELRRSGIQLILNLDERRPKVGCDGRLMRQVILNLIRNAMEVVPARSGQVMVVTSAREDGVEITIDDNGPGIASEILPRIFDPFFTTKQDGTGLGLAVVDQIISEHGGSIDCQSVPSKGTTFRIWFPQPQGEVQGD